MDDANISTIFGPSLFQSAAGNVELLADHTKVANVLRFMLNHHTEVCLGVCTHTAHAQRMHGAC